MSSGHGVGSYRVPESTVDDDGNRNSRPFRRTERHVVAAVRKLRSAEIRADLDYFVSAHHVRGRHIRTETGGRHGVREHFGERETRFVNIFFFFLSFALLARSSVYYM